MFQVPEGKKKKSLSNSPKGRKKASIFHDEIRYILVAKKRKKDDVAKLLVDQDQKRYFIKEITPEKNRDRPTMMTRINNACFKKIKINNSIYGAGVWM